MTKLLLTILVIISQQTTAVASTMRSCQYMFDNGYEFQPKRSSELLESLSTKTFVACALICYDRMYCRTVEYDSMTTLCRLFEGSITTGQLVPSQFHRRVGWIKTPVDAYQAYGQACSNCLLDRYLICSASRCRCPQRSFWNGFECANQRYENDTCQQESACRQDVNNLTCSAENLCRPVTDPPLIIQWRLDGNLTSSIQTYQPVSLNGSAVWVTPGYTGYQKALWFSASRSLYVSRAPALSIISFTFSAWIFWTYNGSTNSSPDMTLISHCTQDIGAWCLHIILRRACLHLGWWHDGLVGNSMLVTYQWNHVAFVFDRVQKQQRVYLNGLLDGVRTSWWYYADNATDLRFGSLPQLGGGSYFQGYMNNIKFISRVKSNEEILEEATLVAYFSFDNRLLVDSGPNGIEYCRSQDLLFDDNGPKNSCILFNATTSFFQIDGFYFLGLQNYSFTFSLWIYPFFLQGTVLQISSMNVSWCLPMLGFDQGNQLTAQTECYGNLCVLGWSPSLSPFSWTHVVLTYSHWNGVRLYVNGTVQNGNETTRSWTSSNTLNTLVIGTSLNTSACVARSSVIEKMVFQGKIDELRIYSRELHQSDVLSLFHM